MGLKKHYRRFKSKLYAEGAFSFANFTLLNGLFIIGFALALGANNFEIGLLVSIPLFANLIQIVSAFILDSTGTKKLTAIYGLLGGRLLWAAIILVAFGTIEKSPILIVIIVLILLCLSQ